MSTTIDQKVVEMRFDNRNFEQNVSTTMSSLDKLKQSLNLTGAAKGLEDVNSAAKRVDMSYLGNAVETVGLKFNAMYTIADQALRNITNSAINTGKRMVSALTIDPVKTGFNEYETKINAIQTILSNTASKGTTMEDVTKVIGELNTYADKTIYNFAEMTRNIGTFTAAGIGLEDSAAAIQGIANLAAASGSSSQQASTAMYQLSQALSTGTVRLMDWNSVTNAGMGGQKFQDALKATAREQGIAVDDMIEKYGSFRESLQSGWLSADVLNTTLQKFTVEGAKDYAKSMIEAGKWTQAEADALLKEAQAMEDAATKVKTFTQLWDTLKESAQSGWSQTWEIIVGDFEEAKETLTKFSEVIGGMLEASANARNELLQGWKDAGGRADLIDSLFNVFEGIMSVVKPIKEAFREIFPPTTVQQLVNITKSIKEFTAKLKLSDEASENLKRTFKGLFAVLDIVRQVFSAVFKAIGSLFGVVGDFGGGILGVTAKIGDLLVKLNEIIKKSGIFNGVLQGLVGVIKLVANVVKTLFGFIGEKLIFPGLELFHELLSRLYVRISNISEATSNMKDSVSNAFSGMGAALQSSSFFKLLQGLWNIVKTIGSGIANVFGSILDKLGNADFSGALDIINGLISGGIGIGLIKFLKSVTDTFSGFSDVTEGLVNIFDGVRGCFEAYQTQLKAGALLKIAGAIAILAAALLVVSLIDSEKLFNAIGAISMLFTDLLIAMAVVTKLSGGTKGLLSLSSSMVAISLAVLVLSAALKNLADMDMEDIGKGLVGIAGLTAIVIATAKILGNGDKKVMKGAVQMVIFAAAIKILASVVEDLSYLSWEELAKGLIGVGVLLAEVSLFMNTAKFSGKSVLTATGIVLVASAIKILASACETFASMSWEELGRGLAAIGGLLAEITIFTKLTGNASKVISTGIAMIAMAAAMKIFASAMTDISKLSWEDIGKGMLAMAGGLTAVVIATHLMPKDMVSKGIGLIAISTALLILASALNKMGSMSWESVGKGLVALGGSMLILAVALNVMKGTLGGSAALLVAVAALAILTPVLSILGAMSWESIAKGLIAIAGALTILGVAGAVLSSLIPAILGLAGAFALIGVGVLAIGVGFVAAGIGLTAMAAGITALAAALAGGATIIVSGLTVIISGILNLIPNVAIALGKAIIEFSKVIAEGAPVIGQSIKAVILSLCDILVECTPVIADTLLKVISAVLKSLVEYMPQIVDSLMGFIVAIIDGIARNIPQIIKSVMNLIGSIFSGILDAFKTVDTNALLQAVLAIGTISVLMGFLASAAALAPAAMVGVLAIGAIIAEIALILAAVGALAQIPGLEWLINEGGKLLEAIGNAIGGFIGGLIGGVMEGISSSLPQIGSDLSDFMTNLAPFIDGAKKINREMLDGVRSLVEIILLLTAANIIEGLTSWFTGGSSLADFGEEIAEFGPHLRTFADSVKGIDSASLNAAVGAAKAIVEMTNLIPNQGGIVSWFTGEQSISNYAEDLVELGKGLKGFADQVTGLNPESLMAAANAGKVLAEMCNYIPNEGGIGAWFVGEKSVSKFGEDLVELGKGLKGFSDQIVGVNSEALNAAAGAAKALADMCNYIPNEGGIGAWFVGEKSVSKFGEDLIKLGSGLKGFSDQIVGVNPENLNAAAGAAKALAEMCNYIPNEGGIGAWFVGEKSISNFGEDLVKLGAGLKGFSDQVSGVNPEALNASANAAKSLAEMCEYIPQEGGMGAWFVGEKSISKFSDDLIKLGEGLAGFSEKTVGVKPETMTAAAQAGKALAEMVNTIPNEGGIAAWFTGDKSVSKFADELPKVGEALTKFSQSVEGVTPEKITAASQAGKALAEMSNSTPDDTSKIIDFGENLVEFGKDLSTYFDKTTGISAEKANTMKSVVETIKGTFDGLNGGTLKDAAKGIKDLIEALGDMKKIKSSYATEFKKTMETIGETSIDALVDSFDSLDDEMKKVGTTAMTNLSEGVKSQESKVTSACTNILKKCATSIQTQALSFAAAGTNLVIGFANGIALSSYIASQKAKAMAKAAAQAAKDELDINSPSKVFSAIGTSIPEGFALGIEKLGGAVTASSEMMADSAIDSVRDSISKISTIVNEDIDAQPTIRPVLDLSDIKSGASSIGSLFGSGTSIGVAANLGAISSAMSGRNQNGGNGDIVSAIDKLRKDIEGISKPTYQINGITYDDGSNIATAIGELARALKIEGRT